MIILKKNVAGAKRTVLARFLKQAQGAAGLAGEVNVLVSSSREIRQLNRRYRGKDKATDVLSFPGGGGSGQDFAGDIAISAEKAAESARRYRHAPADEVKVLILHGVLHLAGYDHERDNGGMARMEERLRAELGLPSALIARSRHGARLAQPRPRSAPRRKGRG